MFHEVELLRHVEVVAGNLEGEGLRRFIITGLLTRLLREKACEDHGYFLAITHLKNIDKGEISNQSGVVSFNVVFKCRTFIPVMGEILEGVVHRICSQGVFLRIGPIKYAFLSIRKMPNFRYVHGEKPFFLNDELGKIDHDVVVRFVVVGLKWIERRGRMKREFFLLASLDAEFLGPISLSGSEELGL